MPTGEFNVLHSKNYLVTLLGRAFLVDNSPDFAIKSVEERLKVYKYAPGGLGTTITNYLEGKTSLGPVVEPENLVRRVDGTGMEINTIPPNDKSAKSNSSQVGSRCERITFSHAKSTAVTTCEA